MIISASRRTDIPSFYSKWFISRIRDGHVMVRNPIYPKNITKINLLPEKIDAIVFWTKNPYNIMQYLPELDNLGFFYYFLFSLTPYGKDFETNVPSKTETIETFQKLSVVVFKKHFEVCTFKQAHYILILKMIRKNYLSFNTINKLY